MIFKGKTLEEALLLAEKEIGKEKSTFIYDVHESKGGFLKTKEVVVEIKGFKTQGMIEIKDGNIVLEPGDIGPYIIPGENVEVKVNGKAIHTKIKISPIDEVEIRANEVQGGRNLRFTISEDNMQAQVSVEYISQKSYKIIDKQPSQEVVVQAFLDKEEAVEQYTVQEVQQLLEEHKIKFGINYENIKNAPMGGDYIIAQGKQPQQPVDDKIRVLFDEKCQKRPLEKQGKVDYLNVGEVEFVNEGELLAIKEPGKDGKIGYDIFGRVIAPEKRKIAKLYSGPGCKMTEDGNGVKSIRQGMPSIKGDRVCVYPVYDIKEDIDIKTGNIVFEGDVLIRSSVREGMKVWAGNNITIYGEVSDAQIISRGDIKIIKSLIGSIVKAGESQLNETQSLDYIKMFKDFLRQLITSYAEIKKTGRIPENVTLGYILKFILDSRLSNLKAKILEGAKLKLDKNNTEAVAEILNEILSCYKVIENGMFDDIEALINLNKKIDSFFEQYEVLSTPASATIGYCQNSQVFSTNNIEVQGKGCYNSNLLAENQIIFSGYPGVVRGGHIEAKNKIALKEVGTDVGVTTILKTSKHGIIEANVAYQNTILMFDEISYTIENPVKQLKAYIAKGELVVEKFKL